jgi:hypothetical protein
MLSHQGDLEFEASSEVSFIQVWNQDSTVSVNWTQNPGAARQAVCQGQSQESLFRINSSADAKRKQVENFHLRKLEKLIFSWSLTHDDLLTNKFSCSILVK